MAGLGGSVLRDYTFFFFFFETNVEGTKKTGGGGGGEKLLKREDAFQQVRQLVTQKSW